MFTGIVEETGTIQTIKRTAKAIEMTFMAKVCGRGLAVGDSIAVNGCCLTAVKLSRRKGGRLIQVDLLNESWTRTNLQFCKPGSLINLERSLKVGARLGGHFMTGHVDGMGEIIRWERAGRDHVLDIRASKELMQFLVFKGSIALDGISLTVAAVKKNSFRIWIIPHTYQTTALRERSIGNLVNLETDLLGKYVHKYVSGRE